MLHRNVRISVAATAAATLAAGGFATAALASPHAVKAAHATTPTIKAAFHKGGKLVLSGPTTVPAGAVNFSVRSTNGDWTLGALSFKRNYSLKKFKADIEAFGRSEAQGQGQPSQAGLRHLRNAIRHSYAYGGFDAHPKGAESGTLLLNRPGTVYVFNDSNGLPSSVHKLKVTKSSVPSTLPVTTATVTGLTNRRFGGAKTLPAHGAITFKNKSTESPHFLVLQHVKEGTTRKQIVKYFQSGAQQAPSWARQGGESTDLLTTGESMTLNLDLPKGEYAEFCFFPDPKTGMPHALMGMVGVVHVK